MPWSLLLSSAVRLGYIRGEVHAYFMLDAFRVSLNASIVPVCHWGDRCL